MPSPSPRRNLVLREVAQCLTRLTNARTAAASIDTLAGFLQALPIAWFAIDELLDGCVQRHLFSYRCSRGFAPFVTRLGFSKRADGVYQGSFADATLILVKVGESVGRGPCLICGVGLEKVSPLNDGVILACVGALIHEILSRVLWFEEHARRNVMLEARLADDNESVFLVDSSGQVVDQYPLGPTMPAGLLQQLPATARRSHGLRSSSVRSGDRTLNVLSRWVAGERPINRRYRIIHLKPQATAPPSVTDRLKQYGLSKRESEVAALVFLGVTNQRIAEQLFISRDTVKSHCRKIFDKLGISRRTEFLRLVHEVASRPPEFFSIKTP